MKRLTQAGFTIVELMIATAVFSTVLLLCMFALLQIGRTYIKGVTNARTQETARTIMDDISRAIQFSGGIVKPGLSGSGGTQGVCVSDRRYSYILNKQLSDTPNDQQVGHVLVVDTNAACNEAQDLTGELSDSSRELMAPNMRLTNLTVEEINSEKQLYRVVIKVIAGENDLLIGAGTNEDPIRCSSERAGTQFCAVSELSTVVQKRI